MQYKIQLLGGRRDALSWLYSFLRPHRQQMIVLAGLSLLTTGLIVIQPYITKLIIDDGLLQNDFNTLLIFSTLLLLLGFATTILSGFNRIQHTRLSGNILFALREDVYDHLQKLPASFYHQQRAGDIISRMDRDISEIQRFAVDTLFASFSAILGLGCAAAMMIYLNWKLSLVLVFIIPLELFYLSVMRPKVEQRNIQVREKSADISSFFSEKIPAVKFIQSMGAEQLELSHLAKLNRNLLDKLVNLQITEFLTSAVPSSLVSIARAMIFIVGGYWVIDGQFTIGSLIAFTTYVGMAIGPTQSLLGLYLAWQRLTVSLDRVRYLRQQPLPTQPEKIETSPDISGNDVTINGLCFSHDGDQSIFDHANLHIPPASKVGITGKSGAGKTTLIDMLQLHVQPQQGAIKVGGTDLATMSPREWRKHISVAPQDPVIFRQTLANNIRYSKPEASFEDVLKAAEAAGLKGLIASLPQGLDSLIGERGTSLSGGERQRIGLARALLQKPLILILDEPTSAADSQTEESFIQQVDELFANCTRIIVSHRESTLRNADLLVEVHDGKLTVIENHHD